MIEPNDSQIPSSPRKERLTRRPRHFELPKLTIWADMPAWLTSVLFHSSALLLMAWLWQPVSHGTGGSIDKAVGIAVVHRTTTGEEYNLEGGGAQSTDSASSSSSSNLSAALPDANGSPVQMDELLGDLANTGTEGVAASDLGSQAGGLGLAGSGLGSGTKGSGTSTKTTVFGVEGSGNSFVYIFDRSDSMNEFNAAPLRAAKRELAQSVESLRSVNQFQIIFYNQSPTPFRSSLQNSKGLLFADDVEKRMAAGFVRSITAFGGTEHVGALKMGINYSPNAIFFLTDASQPSLSPSQLRDLVSRCERAGTTVHSIEFGVGPNPGNDRWIELLAKMTGGKFRYVDVTQLDK